MLPTRNISYLSQCVIILRKIHKIGLGCSTPLRFVCLFVCLSHWKLIHSTVGLPPLRVFFLFCFVFVFCFCFLVCLFLSCIKTYIGNLFTNPKYRYSVCWDSFLGDLRIRVRGVGWYSDKNRSGMCRRQLKTHAHIFRGNFSYNKHPYLGIFPKKVPISYNSATKTPDFHIFRGSLGNPRKILKIEPQGIFSCLKV